MLSNPTNTSTASCVTMASVVETCKAMMEQVDKLKADSDSKVFVFDGTAEQLKAELARQGVSIGAPDYPAFGGPWLAFPTFDALEIRESVGKTYVGTRTALKRALPFLFPMPMADFYATNDGQPIHGRW